MERKTMPVICKYCRTSNMEGSQKCSLCGSMLPYTPAPTPVAPQTPPPQQTVNTAPTTNNVPVNNTPAPTAQSGGNLRFTLFQSDSWKSKWPTAVDSAEKIFAKIESVSIYDSTLSFDKSRKTVFKSFGSSLSRIFTLWSHLPTTKIYFCFRPSIRK